MSNIHLKPYSVREAIPKCPTTFLLFNGSLLLNLKQFESIQQVKKKLELSLSQQGLLLYRLRTVAVWFLGYQLRCL